MAYLTLKRRSEFLRVRGGGRASMPAFVIEGKVRVSGPVNVARADDLAGIGAASAADGAPRFGFTVTKKLGNAVVRNRIRRRLRAAVGLLEPGRARPGYDYVVIAREAALVRPFAALKIDLDAALARVHDNKPRQPRRN